MTTYVIFCIMPIHGHCTLVYSGLLDVFAVMCRVVSLYYADWVAGLPFGIHKSTMSMNRHDTKYHISGHRHVQYT